MLNDGSSYRTIVRRLTELAHPGFTIHNICRWRKGGYEDWLAAQEKFDLEQLRAQSTAEALKEFKDPSAFQDASERLAALSTFRALREIDSRPDEELLDDPSGAFFRLARIVNRQTAERTRRERLEAQKEFTEANFISRLIADPQKLTRVLTEIRARCSSPAAASASPLSGEGRCEVSHSLAPHSTGNNETRKD